MKILSLTPVKCLFFLTFISLGTNAFGTDWENLACTPFSSDDNSVKITFKEPLSNAAFKDAVAQLAKKTISRSNHSDIALDQEGIKVYDTCLKSFVGGECEDKSRGFEFLAHDRSGKEYSGVGMLYVIYDHHTGQLQKYSIPRFVNCPGARKENCYITDK